MDNEAKFAIILAALQDQAQRIQDDLATLVADAFGVSVAASRQALSSLPVVLLDGLGAAELNTLRDRLIFLSKLGLDFTITSKSDSSTARTHWKYTSRPQAFTCPGCGEVFVVLRASEIQKSGLAGVSAKTPPVPAVFANAVEKASITSEFEEIEGVTQEFERLAQGNEETGGLSAELEELGSSSEEVGGVTAEFEEIEDVSAEFERLVFDGADRKEVGSISAELEEIESVSSEVEPLDHSSEEAEEFGEISEQFNEILVPQNQLKLAGPKGTIEEFESSEHSLEEAEGISAELEKIAEPLKEIEEAKKAKGGGKTLQLGDLLKPGKSAAKPQVDNSPVRRRTPAGMPELAKSKFPLETTPPKRPTIAPSSPPPREPAASPKAESGSYKVIVSFNKSSDRIAGAQLLAKVMDISLKQANALSESSSPLTVLKNVSQTVAMDVLRRFQKYKIQGQTTKSSDPTP